MPVTVKDAEHIAIWGLDLSFASVDDNVVVYKWEPKNQEQRAVLNYFHRQDSVEFYYLGWHRSAYNKTIFTTIL